MDRHPTWARWMIGIYIGSVLLVLGGCTAFLVVGGDSIAEQLLPEVNSGAGRTAELDAALDLHGLRLPSDATDITYTTSSSPAIESVGVRFETSDEGMRELLDSFDRTVSLRPGFNPWELSFPGRPAIYGWGLPGEMDRSGLVVEEPRPGEYRYAVLVDERPTQPVVHLEGIIM